MKKTFIFDLDGTIINSMVYWLNLAKNYLKSKNISDIDPELNEKLKTIHTEGCAQYLVDEYNLNISVEQVICELNEMIVGNYMNDIETKDGLIEFLEKHKDHRMCIATANNKKLVNLALENHNISSYFDFIVTCAEVNVDKVKPDVYLKCVEMLDEEITNCIIFEDVLHAVETAKNAGFYTVAIYDEYSDEDKYEIKKIADQYVYSFSEVKI